MMQKKLKAAVIGAGVFGGYHANQYLSHDQVDLVAILDQDLARAGVLAEKVKARPHDLSDYDAVLSGLDIITIATPAFTHAGLALKAFEHGVHVYTEKPVSAELADAEAMVEAAARARCILAVGHQERAVFEAVNLFNIPERPIHIEAVRNGQPSARNLDVSVTLDLMIHDIDLVLKLMNDGLPHVKAEGWVRPAESGAVTGADRVSAELTFSGGAKAQLSSSRISEERERFIRISYSSGDLFIDMLNRKFVNNTPYDFNADFADTQIAKDPLKTSVSRFVQSVLDRDAMPLCTGAEGLAALTVAKNIDELPELFVEEKFQSLSI